MSQPAFQAVVARLVIDPDFRDLLRVKGVSACESDLTGLEQKRLATILFDKGLDVTRTLHKSFRLTKLYYTLPLTRVLLGPDRLAKLIGAFWKANPSVSHYFVDESIAFCEFLQNRLRAGLRIKYLTEIVAYERARLNLKRAQIGAEIPKAELVRFCHDPTVLFEQLMEGKRPRDIPARSCTLVGTLDDEGEAQWAFAESFAS